jgi:membrane protease YdiL (CAAX protease family)
MKKFRGYLKETRRPVYSAAIILPFLCIYHAGTFFLKTTYINGADALIIRILSALSVHSIFASAIVLIACFIFWQMRTRASWKIKGSMLSLYLLESLCFALFLIFGLGWLNTHQLLSMAGERRILANLALYCGAGIYEELFFRGFLLGILLLIFRRAFPKKRIAVPVAASLLAALIFSAFHYLGPSGDAFSIGSFAQRTIAGLYFSALFVTRGFGLTAASHAIYDIVIGIFLSH